MNILVTFSDRLSKFLMVVAAAYAFGLTFLILLNVIDRALFDGVAEIEADTPEDAEKKVENELSKFMGDNKHISDELGARAIQGKAYLPGPDDKDEIKENED